MDFIQAPSDKIDIFQCQLKQNIQGEARRAPKEEQDEEDEDDDDEDDRQ